MAFSVNKQKKFCNLSINRQIKEQQGEAWLFSRRDLKKSIQGFNFNRLLDLSSYNAISLSSFSGPKTAHPCLAFIMEAFPLPSFEQVGEMAPHLSASLRENDLWPLFAPSFFPSLCFQSLFQEGGKERPICLYLELPPGIHVVILPIHPFLKHIFSFYSWIVWSAGSRGLFLFPVGTKIWE